MPTGQGPLVVENTMVPDVSMLPDRLPTASLNGRGRPLGQLKANLYRIPNARNAGHVIGAWLQSLGVIVLALWTHHPVAWIVAFFLMGRAHARFAILGDADDGNDAGTDLLFALID